MLSVQNVLNYLNGSNVLNNLESSRRQRLSAGEFF
jgi:hypothetical protein